MGVARLKLSLEVLATHFFDGAVKIRAAFMDSDDWKRGVITLIVEGEGLPPAPPEGSIYPEVSAVITEHRDEATLVPATSVTVKFEPVE